MLLRLLHVLVSVGSLACAAAVAEPVTSVWLRAAAQGGGASSPEVHSVEVRAAEVVVRSAGLSMIYLGALQTRPVSEQAARRFEFRIPRTAPTGPPETLPATGAIGVFVNGLPMYRLGSAEGAPASDLVARLIADSTRHSPILGYTLRGSPVYGPWGLGPGGKELRRMRSSYQGKKYVAGSGDLDEYNGRFTITPEYPGGVYAHFLSTAGAGTLAYPYLVGDPLASVGEIAEVSMLRYSGDEIEFAVKDSRGALVGELEIVHERPMHLLIVSEDLAEFDHVHPQLTASGTWAVPYTFAHRGRYRLYVDLAQRLERFAIVDAPSAGDTRTPVRLSETPLSVERDGLQVTLTPRGLFETGRDVEIQVTLDNADNIEPYLGAWGHFVLIDEHHRSFIHAHPNGGPRTMEITANFSEPGLYKLWAQFQRAGKPVVIPFTLRVTRGPEPPSRVAIPADAIRIHVGAGGFTPARIETKPGRSVKLAFTRDTAPNCASKVVFPKLGIEGQLPPGGLFVAEIPAAATADAGDEIRFTCGMGMYKGALVAVSP